MGSEMCIRDRWMVDHVKIGAKRAGRDPNSIYILSMTAFYLTKNEKDIETREVREAVGPMVASSSNIFALSTHHDPNLLPADLRDELINFTNVYKDPEAPVETRQMQAAGVHQVAVQPILDTDETIDQFANEIMPAFR